MTAEPLREGTLARAVLAHIEAHPDQWDQTALAKHAPHGTPTCDFAARAVLLAGARIDWSIYSAQIGAMAVVMDSLPFPVLPWTRSIPSVARALLGLEPADADRLFRSANTLTDLRRIAADLWPAAHPIGA